MRLLTVAESRNIDKLAETDLHIPLMLLMENAGRGVAEAIIQQITMHAKSNAQGDVPVVLFLVGTGNNGADGLVAARHLLGEYGNSIEINILVYGNEEKASDLFLLQKKSLLAMGQTFLRYSGNVEDSEKILINRADYIVDGLIGTGFSGELRHDIQELTRAANAAKAIVFSIDVPTGLNADTGSISDASIMANYTITMGFAKVGMYLYPGKLHCGGISIQPLGGVGNQHVPTTNITLRGAESFYKTMIPVRTPTAHKGTNGHVLIIGGSKGMVGAPLMTAYASVRSGAGKTTLATTQDIFPTIMLRAEESIMCHSVPTLVTAKFDSVIYENEIKHFLSDKDVLALGPGLGRTTNAEELVKEVLNRYAGPIVVDADALYALGNDISLVEARDIPAVLTPHVGEFSRLTGFSAKRIESNRVGIAREFAMQHKLVLVLKGAPTVTAYPDGTVILNPTGNSGMGTGGMGDVLTGVIAALIGQGMYPEEAAAVGVYLHGLGADILAEKQIWGYLPKEVADHITDSITSLLHYEG